MDILQISSVQSAIDAGMSLSKRQDVDQNPFVVVPAGARVEDLEDYLSYPTRKRASVKLRDVASFAAFVNAEKYDQTRIYGCYSPPSFTAVINDHGSSPGWRDYTVGYVCPLADEWKTWQGKSGVQMNQADFAQFIENNLPDIASAKIGDVSTPSAADMLEISHSLEAKKKVNFASGVRLSNGQNELTYEEEISGTASKGKLKVPELFTIGIPVLEGGVLYQVQCRLRYRIADAGKLSMWFELVRPHKILEDAVKAVWLEIEQKTELSIFNGTY